jgi:hypothetical protein
MRRYARRGQARIIGKQEEHAMNTKELPTKSPKDAPKESNDLAGGLPRSPGTSHLAADEKMDDDTGLSNTVNTQQPIDQGTRQAQQSNVGRRSDGTPD